MTALLGSLDKTVVGAVVTTAKNLSSRFGTSWGEIL